MTACWTPIAFTALATRSGSAKSSLVGRPVVTAQNPHALVQMSPRIMKVAVPSPQHSATLGQRASSQTVCRSRPRITDFSRE
jgi:hypothetical protein